MIYRLYRRISPLLKSISRNLGFSTGACRYSPTCSAYSRLALAKHGPLRGSLLTIKRVLKCHPWSPGGVDPVPDTH